MQELLQYKKLLEENIITKEEFDAKKAEILNVQKIERITDYIVEDCSEEEIDNYDEKVSTTQDENKESKGEGRRGKFIKWIAIIGIVTLFVTVIVCKNTIWKYSSEPVIGTWEVFLVEDNYNSINKHTTDEFKEIDIRADGTFTAAILFGPECWEPADKSDSEDGVRTYYCGSSISKYRRSTNTKLYYFKYYPEGTFDKYIEGYTGEVLIQTLVSTDNYKRCLNIFCIRKK